MTENFHQPKEYDVVLGGRASAPADGVVLGGLERVKQMLTIGGVETKIDALLDAFEYGQSGLDLVIQALESQSKQVQEAACLLLQDSTEPRVKLALQAYNPYLFFECLCTLQMGLVKSLALSPERKTLVSVDDDSVIKVWDLQTQQVVHTHELASSRRAISVAIIPEHKILVIVNLQDFVEVWNLQTGQKISTTEQSPDGFWSVVISPERQTFASIGHCDGPDSFDFNLCDIQTGQIISSIEMPLANYWFRPIGTNEQILLTTRYDNNITLWDWETGQLIRTLKGHSDYANSAVIGSEQRFLVSGSADKTIIVWNLRTGQQLSTFNGHLSAITCIAVSLDGQTLVSGDADGAVKVWGVP